MKQTEDIKTLVLERVAPGDRWKPVGRTDKILDSLTDGLEYVFRDTGCRNYHLAAFDGKVYSINQVEKTPEPPRQFSLYGE